MRRTGDIVKLISGKLHANAKTTKQYCTAIYYNPIFVEVDELHCRSGITDDGTRLLRHLRERLAKPYANTTHNCITFEKFE